MQKFTTEKFNTLLASARLSTQSLKETVQEMLVLACFYAFKDGNTTPLNTILDFATNSKAVDVSRITKWVELHAGIARIQKEQFILNKKVRDESAVASEEDFARFETVLRTVMWYDIEGKTKAKSVFDLEDYLGTVIKSIEKHTKDEDANVDQLLGVAKQLKAIKGRLAIEAIEAETPQQ